MNLKRTLILCAVCGVLAALLSSAATSPRRVAPLPAPRTLAVEASGDALAAEIARLRDRSHPTVVPQQPARNLFTFGAARATRPPVAEPVVEPAPVAPAKPTVPALKLIGVAEDGPIRTAIVSGSSGLFLAKEGDAVTPRYRVEHVAGDGVDLRDVGDGTMLHLDLK